MPLPRPPPAGVVRRILGEDDEPEPTPSKLREEEEEKSIELLRELHKDDLDDSPEGELDA
jgi:hypothetical protein